MPTSSSHRDASGSSSTTGLLLTGGGARAAYQVGVLEAVMDLRREACGPLATGNPFPIIAGTSAGAINAAALACGADDFDAAVRRLVAVWRDFRAEQVYRADSLSVMLGRTLGDTAFGRLGVDAVEADAPQITARQHPSG